MFRNILMFCLLFFAFCNASFASTPVEFIYLNGSNTNTEKAYKHFSKGISKLHPVLKSRLEKDAFTYEHMLKNGEYKIEETPGEYFWGYKSQEELKAMQERAYMLQSVSPIIAYGARNTISGMLHDAIWVRSDVNMVPIVDELHKKIINEAKQGKKIVLLGYSAGTFITFEYLARRARYIDVDKWFNTQNISPNIKTTMKNNQKKLTCPTAFFMANLATITPYYKVIPNKNPKELVRAYNNLDNYTEQYCMPDNVVIGVINYASPIPLFYSDISNPQTDYGEFLSRMHKYIIEQDFFFLTVNFSDDPLGFPNDVNYKNEEVSKFLELDFEKEQGFLYDYSKAMSWRTVVLAHTSYWNAKQRFAKAIIKGYTEGYKFQYDK